MDAVAEPPPHVAFTVNVPLVHAALPPGTDGQAKVPSLGFGKTSLMSATVPDGFRIVIMTPVFGPGAGEMTPVIMMCWAPEYDGASVWRVIEYVVAP